MNKTKIMFSIFIAMMVIMPITLSVQKPLEKASSSSKESLSLLPNFTEIKNALVTIFSNDTYEQETVEMILRFALLLISVGIIHRVLEYTFGEEGTAKAGFLTDKLTIVISIISGVVTALLTPFKFILNGITIILLVFFTFFLIKSIYITWKETKGEEEAWKVIAKLGAYTVLILLFHGLILTKIGEMPIGKLNLPVETFSMLKTYAKITFWLLAGLTTFSVFMFFYNRHTPAERKTEKEKAEKKLGAVQEEIAVEKIKRIAKIKQLLQKRIQNSITNIENLKKGLDAIIQSAIPGREIEFVQKINNEKKSYLQYYPQLLKDQEILKTDIEKGKITGPLSNSLKEDTNLIDAIDKIHTTLRTLISQYLTLETTFRSNWLRNQENVQKLKKHVQQINLLLDALLKKQLEEKR